MDFIVAIFALFVISSFTITSTDAVEASTLLDIGNLSRSSFPHGFIFGAGSSAYQVCIKLSFFKHIFILVNIIIYYFLVLAFFKNGLLKFGVFKFKPIQNKTMN
jgi:hypothetical protein